MEASFVIGGAIAWTCMSRTRLAASTLVLFPRAVSPSPQPKARATMASQKGPPSQAAHPRSWDALETQSKAAIHRRHDARPAGARPYVREASRGTAQG